MAGMVASHPDAPPTWLEEWPGHKTLQSLFSQGIRSYAYRALGREGRRVLAWDERRLILHFGAHTATWRFAGTGWRASCSCGYPDGRCAHTYVASILFDRVCQEQQWGGPDAAPGPRRRHRQGGRPRQPRPKPPSHTATDAVAAREGDTTDDATRLEVEVDFRHRPGQVAVRFYLFAHGRRGLLPLQSVLHAAGRTDLPERDGEFIAWLRPQLLKAPALRQNLNLMTVTRRRFDQWLERWEGDPLRFIERASQKALAVGGSRSAALVIELSSDGEWVAIAAVIRTPLGRRYHLHDVFEMLASGKGETVVEGELLNLNPPLSWQLLTDVFRRKTPRMRRKHIVGHLADLLEGRLDVVEGECVKRVSRDLDALTLRAWPDGAAVRVQALADGQPIALHGRGVPGGIREVGDNFEITLFGGRMLDAVRRIVRKLQLQEIERCQYVVEDTRGQGTFQQFVDLWHGLPKGVAREPDPALDALLGAAPELVAQLALRKTQSVLEPTIRLSCGGTPIDVADLRQAAGRAQNGLSRAASGEWLRIDSAQAAALLAKLDGLVPETESTARMVSTEAAALADKWQQADLTLAASAGDLVRQARECRDRDVPGVPDHLHTVMRSYQKDGFAFIAERVTRGIGTILADDMGLGKTLQVLAVVEAVLSTQDDPGRALVVCPASVVNVWLAEAAGFCPSLNLAAYTGPQDHRFAVLDRTDVDVLVTNYALLRNDIPLLGDLDYSFVILDEAQYVKNPDSQVATAARSLTAEARVAVTGTPLENRLLDLWSIAEFTCPGLFGGRDEFLGRYQADRGRERLVERLSTVMIRRTKEAVAPELPPRTEEILLVQMGEEQQRHYDMALAQAREGLRQHGPIQLLAAITRLRQICCHPQLVEPNAPAACSAKVDSLIEMLEEIRDEGHCALVFSQFARAVRMLESRLDQTGIPCCVITGDTPTGEREQLVREFQEGDDAQVFLLSLRAGGTGLTLTRATYVFLFDPWWNPAVENQAIDRTHRIGQASPVMAYRLVAAGSVEEKVLALQQEKAALFDAVVGETEDATVVQSLTAEDLQHLLE